MDAKNVDFVYEEPAEEYIKDQLIYLNKIVQGFCEIADIDFSQIHANISILKDVIVRVDKRRVYFKVFHGGTVVSEYKRTALMCYWINKLRPFWIEETEDNVELARKINEKICIHLLITVIKGLGEQFNISSGLFKSYITEVEYSLAYRDITKEALILALSPYYYFGIESRGDEYV